MLFIFFVLIILLLQTVVFSRLSIFGATPDLVLVTVISFAVLNRRRRTTLLAALLGFLQDVMSFGVYLNVISKVLVAGLISLAKENSIGKRRSLALYAVLCLTPVGLVVEALILRSFFGQQIFILELLVRVLITTVYNLLVFPAVFYCLKRLGYETQE